MANWHKLIPDLRYEDLHFIDLPNRNKKDQTWFTLVITVRISRKYADFYIMIYSYYYAFFSFIHYLMELRAFSFTNKYQVLIPPNCSVFSASSVLPLTFALLPKIRKWNDKNVLLMYFIKYNQKPIQMRCTKVYCKRYGDSKWYTWLLTKFIASHLDQIRVGLKHFQK